MTIGCIGIVQTLSFCTPECTRWTQVNEGEPIRVYHDKTNWDPNCRAGIDEPDPQAYLDEAIATWESGYPCGQLFEMVNDPALAQVIVVHDENNFGEPLGTATCACDAEDDVCVKQVDHSLTFSESSPAIVTVYCQQGVGISLLQYVNVWIHELGHILGMGHVYGLPVNSIMGLNMANPPTGTLRDFDLEQLQARYPCGCNLTGNLMLPDTDPVRNQTGDFCPVCQGRAV